MSGTVPGMEDLVVWLRQQLADDAEDIKHSRALVPDDLHWSMPSWLDRNYMLADVEAKRRIIDELVTAQAKFDRVIPGSDFEAGERAGRFHSMHLAVRLLALPYSGRPGYREEWKP